MYPKHFFERFWEGEQRNQLFVGVAFDSSVDARFDIINTAAINIGFDKAFRVGLETEANAIHDLIFDGIANSKMILFDLSDDDRTNEISNNVVYELGIATAIREPFDIVLIRKETEKQPKLPFDIIGLKINFFTEEITEEFIQKIVKSATLNQKWYKSKRVKIAAESIDDIGLGLMYNLGSKPDGFNHFHSTGKNPEEKMSIIRLIDLGILQFNCKCYPYPNGFELAYSWTTFGREVMKHFGIKQMTEEEFRTQHPKQYADALKQKEEFHAQKKILEGKP